MRRRFFRHCAGAIMLLASAGAPRASFAQEAIDESYREVVIDGREDPDPYQLYLFVKATDQEGKLRLCAGFVAEMSDVRFEHLMVALRHPGSFLRVGGAGDSAYRRRPNFLIGTRTMPVGQAPLSEHLPVQRMRAACVETDAAWRDEYASGDVNLGLYESGRARLSPVPGLGRRL